MKKSDKLENILISIRNQNKGGCVIVSNEDWLETKLKTPLPTYLFYHFNRTTKQLSIEKTSSGWIIEKLID